MRILLTADPELPVPPRHYGGIERIVDALAMQLRAAGHTVGLVAHPESTCPVDTFFPWPGRRSQRVLDLARNLWMLRSAARRFRPDVLHSFSRLAYLLPLLPTRLRKIMSYQREPGPDQVRWANRLAGGTLTFTGCSDYICTRGRRGGGDWRTVHNFVDTARYQPRYAVAPDAPLVFLSRIESIKGARLAIDIARGAGRRLVLAGNRADSGPEATYFREQIEPQIQPGLIDWIGPVDDVTKNELLGRAAALLVPVQWDEPFGIVFAEALATGTPIITCARGALPEIIEPGRTGFFINNVADGVAAVARLGELDRVDCREVAAARFSLSVAADAYRQLYERALADVRGTTGP